MASNYKTVSQKVSFTDNEEDFKVATLANFGWHTRAIAHVTGLTESQVNYRCQRAGIRRKDYRDGSNEHARRILTAKTALFSRAESKVMRAALEVKRLEIMEEIKKKVKSLKK